MRKDASEAKRCARLRLAGLLPQLRELPGMGGGCGLCREDLGAGIRKLGTGTESKKGQKVW